MITASEISHLRESLRMSEKAAVAAVAAASTPESGGVHENEVERIA